MNIVVDGLVTNYSLSGKGKLVLLLHGWGDSSAGLKGLQADLSKKYYVLALDLPGFGSTQPPKDVWNLDNYSHFVKNSLAKLELGQPYAVIGHSNGGALAIRAIRLGELKPEKLVLLAASGIRNKLRLRRLLLNLIAKVGNLATIWMPERYRQSLRKSLYGAAGSDILVMPQLEETFKRTVRQDVQADAAKLEQPTLLIYGSADDAVPIEDGIKYNGLIKNSKLETINGAGHFLHHQQPDRVNQLIKDFLK